MRWKTEKAALPFFQIRRFGYLLSQLMMPHLSIFIAWGFINLIASNPASDLHLLLGKMEEALLSFLLPLLIGYTGGKQLEEQRGGAIGAIATIGLIVATDSPQIIGSMLIAPLAVWSFLFFEKLFLSNLKQGYEMLIKNMLAGFIGSFWCVVSLSFFAPIVNRLNQEIVKAVYTLIHFHLLPLVSVLIEPLKVFFFNNTINHGVLTPLGLSFITQTGQSYLFLLETNPGPGLGVLLAYLSSHLSADEKRKTGTALLVHLIGGIQEVYFPYVLMEPKLFFAVILGGVSGTAIFEWLEVGLTSPVSPGSLLLILNHTPAEHVFSLLFGISVSTLSSFLMSYAMLKNRKEGKTMLNETSPQMLGQKPACFIQEIIVACDAGIGSSAMGASLIQRHLKEKGREIPIRHQSVYQLENKADQLVLLHPQLSEQAKRIAPKSAILYIDNFLAVEENVLKIQQYLAQNSPINPPVLEMSLARPVGSKVVLLYEKNQRGTQTMAIEMMRQKAQRQGHDLFFSKASIEACHWNQETLYVISSEMLAKNPIDRQKYQILVVQDLLKMSEFERWLKESEDDVLITKRKGITD
ncbi:PTS transporter subunit EIIC [Enterococcus sp. LJL98]